MPRGIIGDIPMFTFKSKIAKFLLHSQAEKILREAVKAWVKTAEENIPVWSGMSRATLVKLAATVNVNISLFVVPGAQAPKGPGDRSSRGKNQSEGRLILEPGKYGFVYSSSVFHLAVNENVDATVYGFRLRHPGPYHFRAFSDRKFNDTVRAGLSKFPFRTIIGQAFSVENQHIG